MRRLLPWQAVLRAQARYWLRHRVQVVLCLLGIALGVAVFTAIRLANAGAVEAFADSVQAFAGRATHRVYAPGGGGVPDALYVRLVRAGTLSGGPVTVATPRLEARIVVPVGEARVGVTVLGLDPISDAAFRDFSFLAAEGARAAQAEGRPRREARTRLLERFLTTPGDLLLPNALAERLGVRAGDVLHATTPAGERTFRVLGVFTVPEGRRQAFSRTAVMDVAAHQEAFDRLGRLDAIDLIVPRGREAEVRALLPEGVALEPLGSRTERMKTMSRAFRLNLEALALFALLVAVFLIFNAATFAVVQRERSIALLRCIGAPARRVFAALLAEVTALGAVGGAAGVAAGYGLGTLMLRNTGATLFEVVLNTEPRPAEVSLTAGTWLVGLLLGVGAAALGALRPALEGARISPLAALQASRVRTGQAAHPALWAALGAGALALALLLARWPGGGLLGALASATLVALGGAALCPAALLGVSRVLAQPLARAFGPAGRLAARSLGRSLSRTGLACASLMVALALALAIEVTVRSFRETFVVWMQQAVTADLYLHSTSPDEARERLPRSLLAAVRAAPWAADVAVLKTRRLVLDGREALAVALDLPAFSRHSTLPMRGVPPAQAFAALQAGQVVVSEPLAYPLGLVRGERLVLPTPRGRRSFTIAAVAQNYSAPQGVVYFDLRHYDAVFDDPPPERAAIWLKPGMDPALATDAIEALPGAADVRVVPNAALRGNALRVFDRTFAITDLMGSLAAFVAFIAVVSALTALLEERTRELGFLRAVGVSRRRLGGALGLEAALLAVTASVVSWGTGLAMASVLVFVVNRRAFGWTLQFLPGTGSYLGLLVLAVAAALLGAAYPVWRATRLSVTATIRDE